MDGVGPEGAPPLGRRRHEIAPLRVHHAALDGERGVVPVPAGPRVERRERAIEVALGAQRLREERIGHRPTGTERDGLARDPLGIARLAAPQMERAESLHEPHVGGRVARRAFEGANGRGEEPRIDGGRAGGRLERDRREPGDGVGGVRGLPDRPPEVRHRRQAVVRTSALRVVQDAPLRAQHALERLPPQVAEALDPSDPDAQVRPELLDGRVRVCGPVAPSGDLLPRRRRHERLDGPARPARRAARRVGPGVQLRDGDARPLDLHDGVYERREAQAEPLALARHAERNDDGARRGHGSGVAAIFGPRAARAGPGAGRRTCRPSRAREPAGSDRSGHSSRPPRRRARGRVSAR